MARNLRSMFDHLSPKVVRGAPLFDTLVPLRLIIELIPHGRRNDDLEEGTRTADLLKEASSLALVALDSVSADGLQEDNP